jgi:hypothetical protein
LAKEWTRYQRFSAHPSRKRKNTKISREIFLEHLKTFSPSNICIGTKKVEKKHFTLKIEKKLLG